MTRFVSRWLLSVAVATIVALIGGCRAVDFTEKQHLSDPVMTFGEDPAESHHFQKIYYSREGAIGGIGATAGGGCGCY